MNVYIVKARPVCYDGPIWISGVFASEEAARRHIQEENRILSIAEMRYNELRNLFNQDLLPREEYYEIEAYERYAARCDERVYRYEVQK